MTLIQPTDHLSFIEWTLIRLFGKFATRIIKADQPTDEMEVDTWQLFRRTNPSNLEIDFVETFWEHDRQHREQYADIVLNLNNGIINIPVKTLRMNDLLCLKIGREYVELSRHPEGWHVHTIIEMKDWDHWLVASGRINHAQ